MSRTKMFFLKRRLRKAWRHYVFVRDQLDCGSTLANYVSSSLRDARTEVNKVLAEIRAIDPDNCPEDVA